MIRQAGLYLRISEDRSRDELAVTRQREDGLRLIDQRGWTLIDEYIDNDLSAKRHDQRPEFDRLMKDVEAGRIAAIVVSEMPRLSRNRRDDLRIVETCQPRQVIIAVVRGTDIDLGTAAGRLVADMMAGIARHEIEVKGERHKRQMQQAAEAGKPHGGPRPFGFLPNGIDHDRKEAPLVKELFNRFDSGAGLGELADWLNRQSTTTPRGHKWSPGSIKVVLRNPRYAGIRGIRPIINERTGSRSEWYEEIAPAQWQPVVDEEVWRRVVLRLRSKMLPHIHGRTGPTFRHLLSGIALCDICGKHVTSSVGGADTNYARTYRCSSKRHLTRRAEHLDEFVHLLIVHRLSRPDAVDLLAQPAEKTQVDNVLTEMAVLRERLQDLAVHFADGLIDRDQMRVGTERGRQRLDELETQIAEAGTRNRLAPLIASGDIDEVSARWRALPLSTQRAVIQQLMHIVIKRGRPGRPPAREPFDPATVEITWRAG